MSTIACEFVIDLVEGWECDFVDLIIDFASALNAGGAEEHTLVCIGHKHVGPGSMNLP